VAVSGRPCAHAVRDAAGNQGAADGRPSCGAWRGIRAGDAIKQSVGNPVPDRSGVNMWKRFQMGRLARLAGRFPWHALAIHFAYDLHSLRPTQRGPQQPPPHRRARCCQNASRGIGVNRRRARSSLGVSFRITGRVGDRTFRKVVGVAGFEPATPSSRTSVAP
jgi:hypothetical protein